MKQILIFTSFLLWLGFAGAQEQPTEPEHPGSSAYSFEFTEVEISALNRDSVLFLPKRPQGELSPLVVFGHGQAAGVNAYDATFKHLAQKGIAALFVKYDRGFFDRRWRRMADDFNEITKEVLEAHADSLDSSKVVFSGHSKGAYVALMAAGAPSVGPVHSLVLFTPAGYDKDYLKALEPTIPVTLIWGEKDSVIDLKDQQEIFDKLPSVYRQFLTVKSYPNQDADHYFILNKTVFGFGQNGTSAFHYHGVYKWLVSAATDLSQGGLLEAPHLYGDKALESGDPAVTHKVIREE